MTDYESTGPKSSWELRAEKAEGERDRLRAALVALVGVDGRAELEQLEGVMRLMPAPAEDKAATIDAIHALIATAVCRVCAGSGFVAQKQCIDDGFGEVDSCPACDGHVKG